MKALEDAKKISEAEVLQKIETLEIWQYGLLKGKLSDCLKNALREGKEEKKESAVVAALDNADCDHVLLSLLKENPGKIFAGTAIAAYAIGSPKGVVCVPECYKELADELEAEAATYHVEIRAEFVDVRANTGNALIHIVTAAKVADAFSGVSDDGIYVSVNGEQVKKVSPDTKVCELTETSGAKALLLGYKLHKPEDDQLTLEEADIANGVVRVFTEKDCIIRETEKVLLTSRKQGCGKCVFCREGQNQLQHMHKEITEGRGKIEYVELAKEIGEAMCYSSLCSMGQVSAQMSLSGLKNFKGEYDSHIKKKVCPAGACTSFVTVYVDPVDCTGCGDCMDVCPADCIDGKAGYIHMIDEFDCTKCGKCIEACEENAIVQTAGKVPKLPNRLMKVGKFKKR